MCTENSNNWSISNEHCACVKQRRIALVLVRQFCTNTMTNMEKEKHKLIGRENWVFTGTNLAIVSVSPVRQNNPETKQRKIISKKKKTKNNNTFPDFLYFFHHQCKKKNEREEKRKTKKNIEKRKRREHKNFHTQKVTTFSFSILEIRNSVKIIVKNSERKIINKRQIEFGTG